MKWLIEIGCSQSSLINLNNVRCRIPTTPIIRSKSKIIYVVNISKLNAELKGTSCIVNIKYCIRAALVADADFNVKGINGG